jgi:DNA-binding IclR family transcriptional regulator
LKPYTQHTITSKEKLHQVLEEDKHRGYSVDKEELEEGLECIAIPLTIDKFGFYGSMSFSGSVDRFTDTVEPELVKHLRLAREKIMINLCR